jgi:hypothetical protein
MVDLHGLAVAHLGEWKRTEQQARARRDLGLAIAAEPRPGWLARLAMRLRRPRPRAGATISAVRAPTEGPAEPTACRRHPRLAAA